MTTGWQLIVMAIQITKNDHTLSGSASANLLKMHLGARSYETGLWPDEQTKRDIAEQLVELFNELCTNRGHWRPWMVEFIINQLGDVWLDHELLGNEWLLTTCPCTREECCGRLVATQAWIDNPVVRGD